MNKKLPLIIFVFLTALSFFVFILPKISNQNSDVSFPEIKEYSNIDSGIVITEIVADNQSIISDAKSNFSDYIEIYNQSENKINLSEWTLSDKEDEHWNFPSYILKPNERLLIFASASTGELESIREIHTNFRINAQGETIYLRNNGDLKQKVFASSPLPNMSSGLSANGTWGYFEQATPNKANPVNIIEDIDDYLSGYQLLFSHDAGFYKEPFNLSISVKESDIVIRYTLDSSDPNLNSPVYSGPIEIRDKNGEMTTYSQTQRTNYPRINGFWGFKDAQDIDFSNQELAQVVRAQAYIGNIRIGPIITKTYFIDPLGNERYSMPVISLVTNPDNLFSPEYGIYQVGDTYYTDTNQFNADGATQALYNRRGRDFERDVSVEYFGNSGELLLTQDSGLRIYGGWSRSYPKKSFRIYSRESYQHGSEYFEIPFFSDNPNSTGQNITSYKRVVIRNGGNDWEYTIIRDALMQSLVDDILDTQASQPVILFLEGEYWGLYILRESVDRYYFENHYGIDPDDIALVGYSESSEGDEIYLQELNDFLTFCDENDLSLESNWQYVEDQMDIENFINYFNAQIYFTNLDWPGNNIKFWKKQDGNISDTRPGFDGRWRFSLYDTDFGFSLYQPNNFYTNMLNVVLQPRGPEWPNPPHSTILMRSFTDNEEFNKRFSLRMMDFLNSRFRTENVEATLQHYIDIYGPEIDENCGRWNLVYLYEFEDWYESAYIDNLRYAEIRPGVVRENFRRYFQHEKEKEIILTSTIGGHIIVNDQYNIESGTSVNVVYYEDQTIELNAVAAEGYSFAGWSEPISSQQKTTLHKIEDGSVTAKFVKNY